jgi:hypothetical protein
MRLYDSIAWAGFLMAVILVMAIIARIGGM